MELSIISDDRYLCRVQEFRESLRIIDQVSDDVQESSGEN